MSGGVACICFIFNNVKTCFPSVLLSSGAISALLLSSRLSFSLFCSHSFSVVEFSKFSLRYIWTFKFRMLAWTETGKKRYLLLLVWYLLITGIWLLQQQDCLWSYYSKTAQVHCCSVLDFCITKWQENTTTIEIKGPLFWWVKHLSSYLMLTGCVICALTYLPRTLQFCTEIPIYMSCTEDRWVIACPVVCSRMCKCGHLI